MTLHRLFTSVRRTVAALLAIAALGAPAPAVARHAMPRPFGTQREQAAMQQAWLKARLDTFLPRLLREHGIDMWSVSMREYRKACRAAAMPR